MKRSIILAMLAATLVTGCSRVPSAQKNGTLVKLQQSGLINKTWEAELVRGGSYGGGTGVQGAPFDFTIADPVLLEKVQDAFDNQREVRIKYHQQWPAFLSSDSDGYFLDSIEVISAEQGGTDRADAAATTATVVGVGTETIERMLAQNERLLRVIEKQTAAK